MKKIIYALILPLAVVSGLVFADHETENGAAKESNSGPVSDAARKTALEKWEATPDGIRYKEWKASPAGKKVYAGEAKIRKHLNAFTDMEAVVTALSLPPGSRLGFGVMVRIGGDDYILSFGSEKSDSNSSKTNNGFEHLRKLKINDKIMVRSHAVSHAPKYSFPIISGEYVRKDRKVIYKRAPRKGGC